MVGLTNDTNVTFKAFDSADIDSAVKSFYKYTT